MCVILRKEADKIIPFEEFKLACDINRHGYGVVVVKDNRFIITKRSEKDYKNDPDEIYAILDKYKKFPIWVHLRHATVGDIILENAHPFEILPQTKKSPQVLFMHNGTIPDMKDNTRKELSDSNIFAREVLRPLAHRVRAYDPKNICNDIVMDTVLEQYAGWTSVFAIFDSNDEYLIVNQNRGKEFDGWWASNEYSFNKYHARSSYSPPSRMSSQTELPWQPDENSYDPWDYGTGYRSTDVPRNPPADEAWWAKKLEERQTKTLMSIAEIKETNQAARVLSFIRSKGKKSMVEITKRLEEKRKTFFDLAGENVSWDQVLTLTNQEAVELCRDYPIAMGALLIDLCQDKFKTIQANMGKHAEELDGEK